MALLGLGLFGWQLGATGLVDETPPLFAASARAMAETGDWLIPRVNGLPRYDKPPLVYWLMGLIYALPGPGELESPRHLGRPVPLSPGFGHGDGGAGPDPAAMAPARAERLSRPHALHPPPPSASAPPHAQPPPGKR